VSAGLPVRVMVQDAWDQVEITVPGAMSVSELKQKALGMTHTDGSPDGFAVKFRGAELLDEAQSLSQAGVVPRASLIVVPRRRRPVR
jgi:hypothetical protein